MTKKRPFGITLLALLVGLAALFALYHTLQFLHILPFSLGPMRFFSFDLFGALLWGLNAAILLWVTFSLWNLSASGLIFVLVIALLNIILAVLSIIGQSSFAAMFPTLLINGIILLYGMSSGVKKAFDEYQQPEPEVERPVSTPPAAAAAVVAAAYTEPEAVPVTEIPAEPVAVAAVMEEAPAEPEAPPFTEFPAEESAVEAPAAPAARPKVAIDTIEGIGPVYDAKLKEIGILYIADLLDRGASRKGREELAEKTGISPALILKWVNMADLMRISGVGEEFSELLEAAGVDTVKELGHRVPENLYQAMLEANEKRPLVRRAPHLSEVQSWVEQAKNLEPLMTY